MPTPVVWTPQLISRFWDGLAELPVLEKMSFARLAGPALVELLEPWLSRHTECMDFGGGSGHLVSALVGAGYRSASYEPSSTRAAVLQDLLKDEPLFLGAVDDFDRRRFDSVICTEVIEHVRPVDTD
jgi:2-polyprenyl-3-methyl-5-hydroxy-6-metoxy-1,4-benzoquinol methylase